MISIKLPEPLRWDHNAHYHRFMLRQLPRHMDRALDVGCGAGDFARRLAERSNAVDAVDPSAAMLAHARSVTPAPTGIEWIAGDVLELDLAAERYDAVVAIASLHHLPLDRGLRRLAGLLRPGGTLVVLGLARPAVAEDYAWGALSLIPNAVIGLTRVKPRPHSAMPIRDPTTTMPEIRAAVARELPGAKIRRHVFSRHSIVWHKPETEAVDPGRGMLAGLGSDDESMVDELLAEHRREAERENEE